MSPISRIARWLASLAKYLDSPEAFAIRQRGGDVDAFLGLNSSWVKALDIATVLDIGANTGQFAIAVTSVLPQAHIYAFEPLPDCYAELQARMKNRTSHFVAFNIGLGDRPGEERFDRNHFTPASSFLKMTDLHKTAFPFASRSESITVKVECLDKIAQELPIVDPVLVKIDVQGYEDRVLRGGEQTIRRAQLVITETSFEPLYEGGPLFDSIYRLLVDWGFRYAGAFNQLCAPISGRILQEDSIFTRHCSSRSEPEPRVDSVPCGRTRC